MALVPAIILCESQRATASAGRKRTEPSVVQWLFERCKAFWLTGRNPKVKPIVRRILTSIWRYRPRVLTVVLLLVIAALIVLANLSFDVRGANGERLKLQEIMRHGIRQLSYGWPLVWHRYTLAFWLGPSGVVGWYCHRGRLAANVAIWLVLFAAPAGVCEWLLRRYRPRLRWSLRTMLAAVALAATLCGWFVSERNRVHLQDELIATIRARAPRGMTNPGGEIVWVERRGPRWLELLRADRYRLHIIGVLVGPASEEEGEHEEREKEDLRLLKKLRRLPTLQYLFLNDIDCLTPAMADELRRFPQLRVLRLYPNRLTDDTDEALAKLTDAKELRTLEVDSLGEGDDFERRSRECLTAIGRITQLERLDFSFPMIDDERMDCLADLTNLKQLTVRGLQSAHRGANAKPPLFRRLPVLPQLETLRLADCEIDGRDLRDLKRLPRLRSLALEITIGNPAEIAELASLQSLEELAIAGAGNHGLLSPEGLEALQALKRLKALRIPWYKPWPEVKTWLPGARLPSASADKEEDCFRAIEALQQSNPGLIIENYAEGMGGTWMGHWDLLTDYDTTEGIENSVQTMPWLPPTMKPIVAGGLENLEW